MDSEREMVTSEQHARRFLEFIENGARDALSYERLNENDEADIKKGLERLRPAFDQLCKVFIDPLRETNRALLTMGICIGSRAHVAESSKSFWQSLRSKGAGRKPKSNRNELLNELRGEAPNHIIAKRLGEPYNDAFRQRCSREKKKLSREL
jgi:hypothetical protein